MTTRQEATASGDNMVVMSRVLDAPREVVWDAVADSKKIAQWFAPEPMTIPRAVVEPFPGGEFTIVMADEEGNEFTSTGRFIEATEPERMVYSDDASTMPDSFLDMVNDARGEAHGTPIPNGTVTITFEDVGGKTRITFAEEFADKALRDAWVEMQMVEGLDASLQNLEKLVQKTPTMAT